MNVKQFASSTERNPIMIGRMDFMSSTFNALGYYDCTSKDSIYILNVANPGVDINTPANAAVLMININTVLAVPFYLNVKPVVYTG